MSGVSPVSLTPVEDRNGRLYKREDLHSAAHGVNGAKLRACQHLIGRAAERGARRIVSAASVLSPQNAMAAVVAAEHGLPCTVILGATKPETSMRHKAVAIAAAAGADFEYVPVGYNPYLQKAARDRVDREPDAYHLQYGITVPPKAHLDEVRAFHSVGATQVRNLPRKVSTLVVPFGSGNTAASVLLGLSLHRPPNLRRVVLVGIGPDRRAWLTDRLAALGADMPAGLTHYDLHGTGFARYADKMPETRDGIAFHPTYEGKVVRYLDQHAPEWWTRRDGTTCLWIVGGPLP